MMQTMNVLQVELIIFGRLGEFSPKNSCFSLELYRLGVRGAECQMSGQPEE